MFPRLLLLFIGIPLIELVLFLLIGSRIGPVATIATVILTGILGATLTKRQGLQVLANYRQALAERRMPHAEVVEGLMILVAGAMLLTPGFLTDAIGFALLVQPIRAALCAIAARSLKDRVTVSVGGMSGFPGAGAPTGGNPTAAGSPSRSAGKPPLRDRPVIDVEAEVESENVSASGSRPKA